MASVAPGDVMVISTPTTPPSTKAAQMETSSSPSWVLITATTPVSVRRLSCSSFVTCVHLSSCSTPPSGVLSKTQRLLYTQPSCSYVAYILYSKLTIFDAANRFAGLASLLASTSGLHLNQRAQEHRSTGGLFRGRLRWRWCNRQGQGSKETGHR